VIHACVKDNGQVRIVNAASDCKAQETHIQWNIIGSQGPKGDTGDTGAIGPAGPAGEKGPKGDTGAQGAKGDTGATGAQGDKGDTGATGAIGPVGATGPQGEVGPQGLQGLLGLQGPKGDTGATGPAGPQGAKGDTGATGATGPQGATGPVGPQGPPGEQDLRLVAGIVRDDGSIYWGTGFTVTHHIAGVYNIYFNPAFTSDQIVPMVSLPAGISVYSPRIHCTLPPGPYCIVEIYDSHESTVNIWFNFIAVGDR
jgi:hypothetical protein